MRSSLSTTTPAWSRTYSTRRNVRAWRQTVSSGPCPCRTTSAARRRAASRARVGGLVVEHIDGARDGVVGIEELLGKLEHVPLLAAEPEHVVHPSLHERAGVGFGELAGIVGHDVEERAIGLEQARERRVEVPH